MKRIKGEQPLQKRIRSFASFHVHCALKMQHPTGYFHRLLVAVSFHVGISVEDFQLSETIQQVS